MYPSPGWHFRSIGDGKIRPFWLQHIGLLNNPNIFESVPVTNSRTATPAKSEQQQQKENTMEKSLLIKALGLKAEATDDEIMTAINAGVENGKLLLTAMTAVNATTGTQFTEAVG